MKGGPSVCDLRNYAESAFLKGRMSPFDPAPVAPGIRWAATPFDEPAPTTPADL